MEMMAILKNFENSGKLKIMAPEGQTYIFLYLYPLWKDCFSSVMPILQGCIWVQNLCFKTWMKGPHRKHERLLRCGVFIRCRVNTVLIEHGYLIL